MSSLDVSFWLLNSDGTYRAALPEPAAWTLSPIVHEPGAVTIDYPTTGRNFDLLREHVDNDTDAEIAIWTDGRDDGLRAWLVADDSDDVTEAAVWTFTGHFGEVRLEEAVIAPRTVVVDPPSGPPPTEDVAAFRVYAATAGTIMRTLMQEAQARGTLTDLDYATFTNTTDSNGAAWSNVITLKIAPGTNHLEVAQSLVEFGLCEFRMVGRSLRLYEPGTIGVDRTLTDPPVVLRRGRDLRDSPRKRDVRRSATDLLVAGAEGLYTLISDATARARRGRQIEQYRSSGSVTDAGTLAAYGQTELDRVKHGRLAVTHGLALTDPANPVPLRNFAPGDWVWSDTGRPGGMERLQVVQVTIEGDTTGIRQGSAGLNDLVGSREAQLARRIKGIEGGSTLTGTSQAQPAPDTADTLAPAAPLGLVASSSAYTTGDGVTQAQVTASWSAVTTNSDGTAIDDLTGYTVRFRYQTGQGDLPTGWQTAGDPMGGETFSWSPLVVGVAIDVEVQAYDDADNRSAWSTTFALTTANDATPPPVASAPLVSSYLGLIAVEWDGLGDGGVPMPADFDRVEVHVSTTSNFTPDATTYIDELRGAGVFPVRVGASYGTIYYGRLVAVDRAGNAAAASAQASAVLAQVADGDIAEVNIGKLTAGIMSALMTISGIIRTAASGARVELDTTGFRCYSSTGTILLDYSIPSSVLTLRGRILAGLGIGAGRTIDIDPSGPHIRWYPNATQTHIEDKAWVTTAPDGLGSQSAREEQFRNASGQTNGPHFLRWVTGIYLTYKNTAGALFGGRIMLFPESAYIGAGSGSASATPGGRLLVQTDGRCDLLNDDADASIVIEAGGDITLNPASGAELTGSHPFGSRVSGFSFTAQQGYAPDDGYRWYVDTGANTLRVVDNNSNTFIGDGSGGLKNFVIPHPSDPSRWLIHACTESPHAGVEYWGEAVITAGQAVVDLPPYFEALTRPEGRQAQVTPIVPDKPTIRTVPPPAVPDVPPLNLDAIPEARRARVHRRHQAAVERAERFRRSARAVEVPETALLPRAAASTPTAGRFRIVSDAPDGTRVAWLVKAVRADVPPLDAEPLRSAVTVRGDGPYRYIA